MRKDLDIVEKSRKFNNSIFTFQWLITGAFVLLIIYLCLLQVFDFKKYSARIERQRLSTSRIMRGTIIDRNGIKMASDKMRYEVYAHPSEFKDSVQTPKELANLLSGLLQIPVPELERKLKNAKYITTLKKDVDKEIAIKIKKLGRFDISVDAVPYRNYPQGTMAAHILGYYNINDGLAMGVEETANDELSYVEKAARLEKTPSGDVIFGISTDPEQITKPAIGKTVQLTIDSAIQHICEVELTKMVTSKHASKGAVIVLNPKNGEILGYAVYPTYDPNNYHKYSFDNLKNWTLTDVITPGSTFKTLTVASALESGKVNKYTKINDTGKMKLGSWTIENYDYTTKGAPGMISLEYLLEHSSNVASAKVALMMKPKEFYDQLLKFGIGRKTGIDLPGESKGIFKSPDKWDGSQQGSMGYGYSMGTTVIQMISAVSAIANGGVKVTPHVIMYPPEELDKHVTSEQVISPETAKIMTEILTESVGHSKSVANLDGYSVAAKTGTSRKPNDNGIGYSKKLYTSIVGFLPSNDPRLMIYVVVDSAEGGGVWGSTVAAPVFKEVALQSARIMGIAPDKPIKNNLNIR